MMRSRGWYTKAYATPQNARLGGGSRGSRGASNPKVGRLPRNLHEELSPRLDKDRNRSDHARNKHDEAEYSEPGLRVIDVQVLFELRTLQAGVLLFAVVNSPKSSGEGVLSLDGRGFGLLFCLDRPFFGLRFCLHAPRFKLL